MSLKAEHVVSLLNIVLKIHFFRLNPDSVFKKRYFKVVTFI